ncbi:LysR family transcriptional regulator [Thalassococcus lentus]|uniref:LysR family transcriptional regulator n=1 Tax=Thalassococcus lentus TaxID=1210524 RepID=A0ABT4XW70_9RHOB|nr:LysR family transcriptional regulator [Thalassococcus lentus]MDA7426132.1 LysR family transcriptional regulator [Thalassococcus lentus]
MDWSALPPLSALRAFGAYVDTGSVSAAGAALNVSHAAVSQQLRALEAHMGVSLLDRAGRQMRLTAEGDALAKALIDGFGAIQQSVEALTGANARRALQISVTPSFASGWLMPRLARFRERHPEVNLMIDPSAAIRPLEPGGIDLALRYGTGTWPGLEAELFLPSSIAVVAAPALLNNADITTPKDLARFHWLQELGTTEASKWLEQQGAKPGEAGYTELPGNLMLEAARQGQGIAITAAVFVQQDIEAGRLKLLYEDARKGGYYLVTRPGVHRPPLRDFLRWLRSEVRKS